jgi:hypothetical protein
MILDIKQGQLTRKYGALNQVEGEQIKVLGITGFGESTEIKVMLSNDGENYYPYPNNDGTPLVITGNGHYDLAVCNATIRLDCETPDENLVATLS